MRIIYFYNFYIFYIFYIFVKTDIIYDIFYHNISYQSKSRKIDNE